MKLLSGLLAIALSVTLTGCGGGTGGSGTKPIEVKPVDPANPLAPPTIPNPAAEKKS